MDIDPRDQTIQYRHGRRLAIPADQDWWETEHAVHDAALRAALAEMNGSVAVLHSAVLLHGGMLRNSTAQAHVWVHWSRSRVRHPRGPSWNLPRAERRVRLGRRGVVHHKMTLDASEVVEIRGIPVTDLPRTTLDAARFLPPDDAFVAVESLLAVAAGRDEWWRQDPDEVQDAASVFVAPLLASLADMPGQRGVAQAKDILSVAGPFSESAWESELRRIALAAGYTELVPQLKVATGRGPRWIDLGHPGMRRGWEVNGHVKYGGPDGARKARAEEVRAQDLAEVGFRIRPLDVAQIQDVGGVLRMLDDDFGESRARRGMPRLWTPGERQQYSSR